MLALYEDIGHEVWDRGFSSSQCSTAGSCERGNFCLPIFESVALAAVFATRLRGCSGEAVNVYYLLYIGRSGHIVGKHIAYSNCICHSQIPNLQRYLSRYFEDSFEAVNQRARSIKRRSHAYNSRTVANIPQLI